MRTLIVSLAIVFGLASVDAFALSCVRPSERDLVAKYEHIFVVVFTDATFYPDDDSFLVGNIKANFKVLSVIRGDPDRVPHAEGRVSGPNDGWPTTFPLGKKYILVANDGPARWGACSHVFRFPTEHFENCQDYALRKLVGADIPESRHCESEFYWQEFRRLGIKHSSKRRDLEGLRAEWLEWFGALPW